MISKLKPALLVILMTVSAGLLTLAFFTVSVQTEAAEQGNGLSATYFPNRTLSGTGLNRTDPTVNFNWGSGAPMSGIGTDNFSVRWTGQVQSLYSQTYTFYTVSDDGVRLWVNGQLLINNWTDHASQENRGTVSLTAGQKYNIKMEYYENGGSAISQLYWSSPSQFKQIIPTSQLYTNPTQPAPTATPTFTPPTTSPTGLDSEEQAFLTLINQYRQSNGLGTLQLNQTLVNASKWMSQDMGAKNYFSHTDSLGRDPFQRMAAFGYNYNTYKAENIAAGYSTAASVMAGWQSSRGHNQNMLGPNYKVIGIGRAYTAGSTYGWYWTTDFGGQ